MRFPATSHGSCGVLDTDDMIDPNEKAKRWLLRFMEHDRHALWVLAGFLHSVPVMPREQVESLSVEAMGNCLRALMTEQQIGESDGEV